MQTVYVILAMASIAAVSSMGTAQTLESGIDLYRSYKYAEAERALSAAVAADPDNAQAQEYFGLAQLGMGKIAQAETALTRAQQLAPNSDSVKVGLARVFIEKKQFDRAEAALRQAASLNGNNAEVPLYRGAIKLAQRNYQGAADDLTEAQSRKTDNAYAYYYAGLAWNGLRRPDKMVENFQTFLMLAPDAPEADRVRSLLRSVR